MAHFAKIIENTVTEVIVVSNEDCGNLEFPESEPVGQEFIASLGIGGEWLQTSYNNNFRGRYAGIGYKIDRVNNVFISPKPYESWLLDENFEWQAPTPMPTEGFWGWNESLMAWEEFE